MGGLGQSEGKRRNHLAANTTSRKNRALSFVSVDCVCCNKTCFFLVRTLPHNYYMPPFSEPMKLYPCCFRVPSSGEINCMQLIRFYIKHFIGHVLNRVGYSFLRALYSCFFLKQKKKTLFIFYETSNSKLSLYSS